MGRDDPAPRRLTASRRRFNRLFVGLLVVAPCIAIAQGAAVVRRIGVLEVGGAETPEWIRRQAEPLQKLGWVEGQNLHVERRYANGPVEALQPLAEELVRAKVEVIVTASTPATIAAKRATATIPIVIRTAGDPVLLGLVASLARPGGNVTGFSNANPERTPKNLSLLKELIPGLERVGVLEASTNPYFRAMRSQFEQTCRALGLKAVFVEVAVAGEIVGAIAELARQRAQALVVRSDGLFDAHWLEMRDAALKYGLPIIAEDSDVVREAGALLAYSSSQAEQDRRRAYFVDRILRGAKPADLPVEQPTQFELLINLRVARMFGVTIPQSVLLRADEVIQ